MEYSAGMVFSEPPTSILKNVRSRSSSVVSLQSKSSPVHGDVLFVQRHDGPVRVKVSPVQVNVRSSLGNAGKWPWADRTWPVPPRFRQTSSILVGTPHAHDVRVRTRASVSPEAPARDRLASSRSLAPRDFLQYAADSYDAPLPKYVRDELRGYLRCGLFEHGFLRARCEACGYDLLVAFSCKARRAWDRRSAQACTR